MDNRNKNKKKSTKMEIVNDQENQIKDNESQAH